MQFKQSLQTVRKTTSNKRLKEHEKKNGHNQSLLTQFNNGAYLCDYRATIVQFVLLWWIKVSVLPTIYIVLLLLRFSLQYYA
jgi:hypothetical protein